MTAESTNVHFLNPETLPRPYAYSQVAEITGGRLVLVSGQVPLDTSNELVGVGDFAAQARRTFENVRLALEAVGCSFADVVKLQVFMTDMADLPALRRVREEFLDPAHLPTMTTVQVAALFRPDVMIEVDAMAVARTSR
jgi:reactive intermediate/imine deaminase